MKNLLFGFLLVIVLIEFTVGVLLLSGIMPTDATSNPPIWEKRIAGTALDNSITYHMKVTQNPIVPTEQNLVAGMELYTQHCQVCHGGFNQPSILGTTSLYPRAPQFGVARHPQTLRSLNPTPSPTQQKTKQATSFWIIKHGIRYTGMPAWEKSLKDEEIWEIVTFMSAMRDLPPSVLQKWKAKSH